MLAVKVALAPAQNGAPFPVTARSAAVAGGLTVKATAFPLPEAFVHLLSPKTLT
ncbi:hypothetical protein D3C87_2041270 [compost metagenome]